MYLKNTPTIFVYLYYIKLNTFRLDKKCQNTDEKLGFEKICIILYEKWTKMAKIFEKKAVA